jgi:hypothetical protein
VIIDASIIVAVQKECRLPAVHLVSDLLLVRGGSVVKSQGDLTLIIAVVHVVEIGGGRWSAAAASATTRPDGPDLSTQGRGHFNPAGISVQPEEDAHLIGVQGRALIRLRTRGSEV